MRKRMFFPILLTVLMLSSSVRVFADSAGDSSVNRLIGTTTDAISDFVREELDEQGSKVKGYAVSKIKSTISRVGNFIKEKIGVNLYEGAKLFGQFLLWLFEALANLVRWLLSFF